MWELRLLTKLHSKYIGFDGKLITVDGSNTGIMVSVFAAGKRSFTVRSVTKEVTVTKVKLEIAINFWARLRNHNVLNN